MRKTDIKILEAMSDRLQSENDTLNDFLGNVKLRDEEAELIEGAAELLQQALNQLLDSVVLERPL